MNLLLKYLYINGDRSKDLFFTILYIVAKYVKRFYFHIHITIHTYLHTLTDTYVHYFQFSSIYVLVLNEIR